MRCWRRSKPALEGDDLPVHEQIRALAGQRVDELGIAAVQTPSGAREQMNLT
jgi:hypothetical protein